MNGMIVGLARDRPQDNWLFLHNKTSNSNVASSSLLLDV